MTITIALLQGEQARYFVTSSLLGTVQAAPATLQAEAVRAVLWALCRGGASSLSSDSAVSTRTLLHHTRHLLLPFAQQPPASSPGATPTTEQIDRQFLERLAEQGDLLQIRHPERQWLPAPPRLVPLGSRYLLAGGLPLLALPGTLQKQIILRTTLRLLPLTADKHWPYAYQRLASWLGPQPPSLRELQNAFQQAQLIPVDQGARESTPSQAQVYLPHAPGSQEERWQPLTRVTRLSAGRYLLRRPDRWQPGRFQYSIALLDQGRLLQESHPWEEIDIPRLCYALDQAAGRRTIARWYGQAGSETLTLHLESYLPRREYRLLQAVGERLPVSQNSTWRYCWRAIARSDLPLVAQALQSLGITSEHQITASTG